VAANKNGDGIRRGIWRGAGARASRAKIGDIGSAADGGAQACA